MNVCWQQMLYIYCMIFNLIIGCEESQEVTKAFRKLGQNAYSCDLKPCSGKHPEWHIQDDIFTVLSAIKFYTSDYQSHYVNEWHGGIFFPDCTYLTCSAEWAYSEGPYHQKVQPETLVGIDRQIARDNALSFVNGLWESDIENISIENPVGILSTKFKKPSQIIQPYQFGDDASKKTCLWLKGFPVLTPTKEIAPRIVKGRPRWANQTDSGQNNLSPSSDRAEIRSKTYPGIAKAMAEQWTKYLQWKHGSTS